MAASNTLDQYELLKIILEAVKSVLWPLVVIFVVIIFKKEIKTIFSNAKKVELPGGFAVEIDKEIKEIKELAVEIKRDRLPEKQELLNKQGRILDSKVNKQMVQLGLKPSPSGLDLNYYKSLAEEDPRIALIGLRIDLEIMLRNLAIGFKIAIEQKSSISKIISKLLDEGAIIPKQYELLNKVFAISNLAAHGGEVTKLQAYEIIDIGQVLVDDYVAWLSWGFVK